MIATFVLEDDVLRLGGNFRVNGTVTPKQDRVDLLYITDPPTMHLSRMLEDMTELRVEGVVIPIRRN